MIYMIGGAPRVGKSTLAQKFTHDKGIPWVSTDTLLFMVHDTMPELNLREPYDEIPGKFFPFLDNFIKNTISTVPDYVIEGDAFRPGQIAELRKKYDLRVCFLGSSHTSLELMREHVGHNNWMSEMSEKEQAELPEWIMKTSGVIKAECLSHDIPYFDTSNEFHEAVDMAFQGLMAD